MKQLTRRHWGRDLRTVVRYPLTMLEEKRVETDVHVLSHFRVILLMFAVGYTRNFPDGAAGWPIIALGMCIVLALPVRDLFQRIPVAEGLAALTAIAQRVTVARTAQIVDAAEIAVEKIEDVAAGVETQEGQ